jgi:hypothetical protein
MRLLTFILGLMVCALGIEVSRASYPTGVWVWWFWLSFWCVLGLAVAVVGLVLKMLKGSPAQGRPGLAQRTAAPTISKQGE